jgi:tetratricopeptide (TPR) repeat protein
MTAAGSISSIIGMLAGIAALMGALQARAEVVPLADSPLAGVAASGPDSNGPATGILVSPGLDRKLGDGELEALVEARDLNSRALEYQHQGNLIEARKLYAQCLTILQSSVGSDHPAYAATLLNLAALYQTEARFQDAEELYDQALSRLKKTVGEEHYIIGFNLNNLGMLYVKERRYNEGEEIFKRSLAILEKALGTRDRATIAVRHNLALLDERLGQLGEAEELYKKNIAILETMADLNKPALGVALASLRGLYLKQGRNTDANLISARIHPDTSGSKRE